MLTRTDPMTSNACFARVLLSIDQHGGGKKEQGGGEMIEVKFPEWGFLVVWCNPSRRLLLVRLGSVALSSFKSVLSRRDRSIII